MSRHRVFDPDTSPLEGTMLLEASAGTGKTYALERIVARLVGRDINPLRIEDILVVTFTNRAAREMKERIRTLLSRRSKETERSNTQRDRYRAAISGFDRAAIYTIHGFCQMVLSSWPFESSSPFRQELVPGGVMESGEVRSWISGLQKEDVDRDLMRTAYTLSRGIENLISSITDSIVKDNIPQDSRVLPTENESADFAAFVDTSTRPGSPLNIAAVSLFSVDWSDSAILDLLKAATGKKKTAPSLAKIRSHISACRGVSGILPISEAVFGDPAGVSIKNHFLDLFHAGVTIIDESTALSGEASGLARVLAGLFHEMEPYVEFSRGADKPIVSLAKPYMQCAFSDMARKAVEEKLENLKDSSGRWGYADLIRRVADKISETDSPLLPILRNRFKAALIDEFQDTDPRQWKLFNTIFGDPGSPHLLALIGDPKQSIYGFRGTGLQAYNDAASTVSESLTFRLDTNYRSTSLLVSAGNRFFAPLFRTPGFEAVNSGKIDSDELLWRDGGTAVSFIAAESKQQAAASIVSEIRSLLDPADGGSWRRKSGKTEPVSASDIAVLVRGKIEEDDILYRLAAAGIPAVQIRSRSVFARDFVSVIRGLLEAFESPRNTSLWRSVLMDGFFSLPPDLLVQFEEDGRIDDFVERGGEWQSLFLAGRSTEAFEAFLTFSSIVGTWTREAGRAELGEYLSHPWPQRVLADPDGMRQWQDWRQICELIQNRQAEGVRDIAGITSWMTEQAGNADPEGRDEALRLETEAPAIRVMTMHTAKGLEFPLVFLHGGFGIKSIRKGDGEYRFDDRGTLVVDRVRRESNRAAHLAFEWEEDKRLWYVAFTRASVKLWLPLPTGGGITQMESLIYGALDGLLEPSPVGSLPPHQCIPNKEADEFRDRLRVGIEQWTQESPQLFSVAKIPETSRTPLGTPKFPEPRTAALPPGRPADRDPVTSSYTSLLRSASDESPTDSDETGDRDVDGVAGELLPAESAGDGVEPLPLSSDRGALFGTLVHAVLEECDFKKARDMDEESWYSDSVTEDIFQSLSRRFYPPDWYRPRSRSLKKMVRCVLRSDIPDLGRLCNLEKQEMRAEVEFLIAVPHSAELVSEQIRAYLAKGFLKGFIDLLLKTDGRWWVVDWKTNVPPGLESAESYDQSTMKEIMDHHHYHLQYELYLLALCATLSGNLKRPVRWETEIGGAAYLFVRGMREDDDRAVFVSKPDRERMLTLASVLGLEGVLV